MTKKVAITYPLIFENIKEYFSGKDVEIILTDNKVSYSDYDLIVLYDEYDKVNSSNNIINIHPSILPAYKENNAIIKAFNEGVKVSGVTIHSKNKIIAQYPVLIGTGTHIDDFMNELLAIEKKLVPIVIDAILNDKVFDFSDLFSHSCRIGECSGCGRCH